MPAKGINVLLEVTFPATSDEKIVRVKKIDTLDLVVEYSSAYKKLGLTKAGKEGNHAR